MAPRKQVTSLQTTASAVGSSVTGSSRVMLAWSIGHALFAGALVYATYFPSDSVAVEQGDALWLTALSFVVLAVVGGTWQAMRATGFVPQHVTWRLAVKPTFASRVVDASAIAIAFWMMVSAGFAHPDGNLRQSSNEAWLWCAGAAFFISARRLFAGDELRTQQAKRMLIAMLVGCAVLLAVHAIHQSYVSLPRTLAEYRADPDRVLRLAGIDAPPGSAARMVFENRLLDGGPTATFALANSVAAVLAMGLVVMGTIVWERWSMRKSMLHLVRHLVLGVLVLTIVATALLLTNSRAGVLGALAGLVFVAAYAVAAQAKLSSVNRRRIGLVIAGGMLMVASIVAGIAMFGRAEWSAQAPSSLAFRLQYWRSTWAMVLDHPWLGIGPGNFQATYPRYREASASESIAEPHNFWFETLASGGLVAGALLIVLWVAMWRSRDSCSGLEISPADPETPHRLGVQGKVSERVASSTEEPVTKWWWLGAGSALGLIWLLGLATGQPPDYEAHVIAVPAGVMASLLAWRTMSTASEDVLQLACRAALIAVMLHLTVSSGWTIPGIAIWVWSLAALAIPVVLEERSEDAGDVNIRSPWPILAHVSIGLVLLFTLRVVSIGPSEARTRAMQRAMLAQQLGQMSLVDRQLEIATASDPWSPEPWIWRADLARWRLISSANDAAARSEFDEAIAQASKLSGNDPALLKMLAVQPLHLYQRWHREDDLKLASQLLQRAHLGAPTDAAILAQQSEIAESTGDLAESRRLARLAGELSEMGENLERRLYLQPILVVDDLGARASGGPVTRTAKELLANQLDSSDVLRNN